MQCYSSLSKSLKYIDYKIVLNIKNGMDRNTFRLSLSERYLVGTPVLTFILYSGAELVLSAAVYLVYFLYSCTSAGCHFVCDETTVSIVTVVIISQDCEVFRLN